MSVESEIKRIKNNISNAYSKIAEKGGILPEIQKSSNLASAIDSISLTMNLQEKTVTPTNQTQEVIADEGYDGLSKVTIEASSGSGNATTESNNSHYHIGLEPPEDTSKLWIKSDKTKFMIRNEYLIKRHPEFFEENYGDLSKSIYLPSFIFLKFSNFDTYKVYSQLNLKYICDLSLPNDIYTSFNFWETKNYLYLASVGDGDTDFSLHRMPISLLENWEEIGTDIKTQFAPSKRKYLTSSFIVDDNDEWIVLKAGISYSSFYGQNYCLVIYDFKNKTIKTTSLGGNHGNAQVYDSFISLIDRKLTIKNQLGVDFTDIDNIIEIPLTNINPYTNYYIHSASNSDSKYYFVNDWFDCYMYDFSSLPVIDTTKKLCSNTFNYNDECCYMSNKLIFQYKFLSGYYKDYLLIVNYEDSKRAFEHGKEIDIYKYQNDEWINIVPKIEDIEIDKIEVDMNEAGYVDLYCPPTIPRTKEIRNFTSQVLDYSSSTAYVNTSSGLNSLYLQKNRLYMVMAGNYQIKLNIMNNRFELFEKTIPLIIHGMPLNENSIKFNLYDTLKLNDIYENVVSYSSKHLLTTCVLTTKDTDIIQIDGLNITVIGLGEATINCIATDDHNNTFTYSKSVTVAETIPNNYTINQVENATYGFALNDSGYYESQNKGITNSYALCRLYFYINSGYRLKLNCINSSESGYDFGILSNVDTTLVLSNSADSTNVFKSFKGSSSIDVQVVDYGEVAEGEHTIDIKYKKDSSGNSGNDSLQFQVEFEEITTTKKSTE